MRRSAGIGARRSAITTGTACPASPSQSTESSANHEKSSAAGRKVTTPSTTADSHTRSGGRSPSRIAHAPAYARLNAGDAATSAAERLAPLPALRRTIELGRADYVHAAGSFATLAILFALTRLALGLLLSSQADTTVRVAIFLADLVLSPLLFLGAAIVYVDLAARVGLSREERRRLRLGVTGQAK